jgi:hypothetical protein
VTAAGVFSTLATKEKTMSKERKVRKTELRRYEVRWIEANMIFMRWFCRSNAAQNFARDLKAEGYEVLVAKW